MDPLAMWAMICIVGAVLLFVIEVFMPSGGLLGAGSFFCLVAAIGLLFAMDNTYGWIGLIVGLILVPVAIGVALKVFPHTFVGRRLILSDAQKADTTVYSSDDTPGYADLLGAEGLTLTELRPVGTVNLNGRRVECLAERGVIEPHEKVKVVSVEGMQIKVRKL